MFRLTRAFSLKQTQPGLHAVATITVTALLIGLACVLASLHPHTASAQSGTVVQSDFEDGTLQGWIPRGGGVVLTNTTEAAQAGTRSLKTTGRTQGFHGPSLNILPALTKGATYQVTASVRLVAGEAATTLRVTVQRTPMGGSNQFDTVVSSANNGVTDAAWVTLTGLYSYTTDSTGLLLYVEATSTTAAYYLDSFSITQLAPAPGTPPNTAGAAAGFETNTNEGWSPRVGNEALTVTAADKHNGNYSLLTTGRTAAFQGPRFDVSNVMFNGSRYRISLWAKMAPGEPNSTLRVSLQRNLGSFPASFHTVVPNTAVTANAWVPLTIVYDVALANSTLTLYVESSAGTASFYIDDFQIAYVPPPVVDTSIPSVYQVLAPYFPVGVAIWAGDVTGVHSQLLTKHFNSVTAENDMKFATLQPTEGNFNFAPADLLVNFAKANHMLIRGHTLAWHQQNPAWLFQVGGVAMTPTPENKALALQRLENHIRAVVGRYKDDVFAWDVVNEAVDPSQPDCLLHSSPWYQITGKDYIDRAFQVAHEVAPNAKLYYNDFSTTNTARRACILNLVTDLKNRGIPIDGVGHQMHNNVNAPSVAAITETINLFSDLGLDNQITEMDVSVYTNSTAIYTEVPEEVLIKQGYQYRDYFQAFRQLQGKISSVTLWGQADDHTWLKTFPINRLDLPLLFGEQLQAKHAYWGVVDPSRLPGADLALSSSADSASVLSGQNVTYTVTVKNNGMDPAANVSLTTTIPPSAGFQSLVIPAGWTCPSLAIGFNGPLTCTATSLATGASAQFKLTVAVNCPTPDGTEIVSSATVTSASLDPNLEPNNAASVKVKVSNPPPTISGLAVDKPVLRPANGKMVDVTLLYSINDNCDTGLVPTIKISSDKFANPPGTFPAADWQVVDDHHIRLRAESAPNSRVGRTYTITLTVTDSSGLSTSSSVNVSVFREP
jgi:endo-1,4-beta-xylanase